MLSQDESLLTPNQVDDIWAAVSPVDGADMDIHEFALAIEFAVRAAVPTALLLYTHTDGRYAVSTAEDADFAAGDPDWHRVGPVDIVRLGGNHG